MQNRIKQEYAYHAVARQQRALCRTVERRMLDNGEIEVVNRLVLELCIHNCAGWSSSGGPWITPEYAMQTVVVSETHARGPIRFSATLPQPQTRRDYYRDIAVLAFPTPRDDGRRIEDLRPKAGYEVRYGQQPQLDSFPIESVVSPSAIVDLTDKLGSGGRLTWDVPEGNWTILRIGYTPTGKDNHPAPVSGRGLECDKLSRAASDVHWAGMMDKIIQDLGPLAGQTLNNCLIDSYEVGHQNWTPRFRDEFKQRRGYDPLLLLPVLTGRVVDSGEVSERFLWDLRRTIADLFADNYFGRFSELCHARGMLASIEPYDGPFECLLAGRGADIPMGEFWVGSGGESSSCKLAASVAHTYGRRIVGAESFTASPQRGRWQNHPYALKAVGDLMYSIGINRFVVHRYAHQPWLDKFPGMTMGQWGTHFERTVTWWNPGAAWIQYLTRCQYLLQQGLFAADICYFAGEAVPNGAPHNPGLKAKGYDYDACNADVLLNCMEVKNGRLMPTTLTPSYSWFAEDSGASAGSQPPTAEARATRPAGWTYHQGDGDKYRGWLRVRTPGRMPISAPQFRICARTSSPDRPPDSKRVSRLFSMRAGRTGQTGRPPGSSGLDRGP